MAWQGTAPDWRRSALFAYSLSRFLLLSPLAAVISVTPKQTHTHISLLPLLFPFSAAAVVDTHSQQSTDPDQVV